MESSSSYRLERFTDRGKFVSVSSDKHNIYVFFLAEDDEKLYRIICDKYMTITSAEIVITPKEFNYDTEISFFRPAVNNQGDTIYSGIAKLKGEDSKFEIVNDVLTFHGPITRHNKDISKFKAGDDFFVTSAMTKKQSIFFVGYDRNNGKNDPVFCELDTQNDIVTKVYYLYSDSCDIHLTGVDVDVYENRVYVVGYAVGLDGYTVYPYVESFFLRKNPFLID